MDQHLPPDAAPPTGSSVAAKQTPEKLSQLEQKQDSKLGAESLVSRLQQDAITADDSARKNGDIDVASDDVIRGKPYSHVDAHKELDSKKPSSAKVNDSHKITSIQFAELPLDTSISKSLRDPDMKSDLQRSSTVPEISLRKELPEDTVTVAAIANADVATIATGGSTSLIDWNAENRTLYRNNVEMRSVGNLSLHSTIEEEPGYRSDKSDDKKEMINSVTEAKSDDAVSWGARTAKSTKVLLNGSDYVSFKAGDKGLPSKCGLTQSQTASPSHVAVSFPKDPAATSETSAHKIEKVSDSVSQSTLTDGPETKLSMVSGQTSKEKQSREKETVGPGTIPKSDNSCKQVEKDITSGEKKAVPSLVLDSRKETADDAKTDLGTKQCSENDAVKPTIGKGVTSGHEAKNGKVSSSDSLKRTEEKKTTDKSKDDKEPNLEGPSKPIAIVDQTEVPTLSSTNGAKGKSEIAKKEGVVSLAEELKSELTSAAASVKAAEVEQYREEKPPSSEGKNIKLESQLVSDKSKPFEPPSSATVPAAVSEPGNGKITRESKGKQNGSLTDEIMDKLKQSKDSFNLEQKFSSTLVGDIHLKKTIPLEEKEVIPCNSEKDIKDETVSSKAPASEKASPLKEMSHKESSETKEKLVKPEEDNKMTLTKDGSLIQTSTTDKMAEASDLKFLESKKTPDKTKAESKETGIHEKAKDAGINLQSTDQNPNEKTDALKRPDASVSDKQDLGPKQNLTKKINGQTKDQAIPVTESETKKEKADLPQIAKKEIPIPSERLHLTETLHATKTLPLEQKEEAVQMKEGSLEKKHELEPSSYKKETAPKKKEVDEAFPQQEKIRSLPDSELQESKSLAASPATSLIETTKESTKESEKHLVTEKLPDISPGEKNEADKRLDEHLPLTTTPSPKIKDAKHEIIPPEKSQVVEPLLKSIEEKENAPERLEEVKVDDSAPQVVSSGQKKTAKAEEKVSKGLDSVEKSKPISFISNFSDKRASEICDRSHTTKAEVLGDKAKTDTSVDRKTSPDRKTCSDALPPTKEEKPSLQQKVKPEDVDRDESSSSVPEKQLSKEEGVIKVEDSITAFQEKSDVRDIKLLEDKGEIPQATISIDGKELEASRIEQKGIETPKPQTDTLKEENTLHTSVPSSKVIDVPLDVSVKAREVPSKEKETKEPETKQPCISSVDKENIFQHKRVESVVIKDSIVDKSKPDSAEIELVKEPSSIIKDTPKEVLTPSPQTIKDDTVKKEEDISAEPSMPKEQPKSEVPKELILPDTTDEKVASESSMKVAAENISLVSRGKDEKLDSFVVPAVNQEKSENDGAKTVKADEERPYQVPKELAEEKSLVDDGDQAKEVVSHLPNDVENVVKETSLVGKSGEDDDKTTVINIKTLPVTANGLVPHIAGGEKVEVRESEKDKEEKDVAKTQSEEVHISETEPCLSDEQKQLEVSGEEPKPCDISGSTDNQVELTTEAKESLDAEKAKDDVAAKEGTDGEIVDSTDAEAKTQPAASPKRSKLITKSGEAKARSVSPQKESAQMKRKVHKRSESRDKAEIGTAIEKQDAKEGEKKESEEEVTARDTGQRSPRKRRLRRAYRSAEERDSASVTDSAKVPTSPVKKPSTAPTQKGLTSPKKTPYSRNGLLSPTKSLKGDKKLPPIKAAVGFAPNPNLKNIKSKVGSFDNIHYKPKGGDKKVITVKKLEWNASSKVKSLENTNYKPGGGDKKIITQKLDFKEKAQAKSMDSESDTEAIDITKKKDSDEDEASAPTAEAHESKEPDSVEAKEESSGDQELTA